MEPEHQEQGLGCPTLRIQGQGPLCLQQEFGAWEEMGIKLSARSQRDRRNLRHRHFDEGEAGEPESVRHHCWPVELAGTIEEYFKEQGVPEGRVLTNSRPPSAM